LAFPGRLCADFLTAYVTFEPREDARGVQSIVSSLVVQHYLGTRLVQHGAMVEETEDVVTNPGLLRCFEEAERTFSLDKDVLGCSQLATNAYTHDSDSDGEQRRRRPTFTFDKNGEDSTVKVFFFQKPATVRSDLTMLPVLKHFQEGMRLNTESNV